MVVPAVTRQRRPFLAPVWLILVAVLAVAGVAWGLNHSAGTTVVVLARPPSPAAISAAGDRPPGGAAAPERLAHLFGTAQGLGRVDAVYATEAPEAQQAAEPLAQQLHTRTIVLPGADAGDIAGRLMDEHQGDKVVLIASAALLPQLMLELSGLELGADARDEPDALYILSIPSFGQSNLVRARY